MTRTPETVCLQPFCIPVSFFFCLPPTGRGGRFTAFRSGLPFRRFVRPFRNDVVSGLCQKSLLLDRCGNDPYKDTWEVLYKSATQRFYSLVFSKPPVNLSDQGIRLLQLLLGLGSYGLSHGYLSPYNWSRDRRDLAGLVNEFHLTGFIDDFVANADKK